MSAQPHSILESLYKESECSVCFQLFTEPKTLTNCSHILCCECLKNLIKTGNQKHCPKCRKPITLTVSEVDSLEPARAEAEIVKFLRNIKNCDLCQVDELSTTRCLECNYFICEKCKIIHSKLKPLHSVVSMNFQTKEECYVHKNQPLEFFCLMCAKIFCLKCDEYLHVACLKEFKIMGNYMIRLVKQSSDLVQQFTVSSESRKQLFLKLQSKFPEWRTNWCEIMENTPTELRVVLVNEFSVFCRQYLNTLKKEVEKDIEFLKESIDAKESLCTTGATTKRIDQFLSKLNQTVRNGKLIVSRIEKAVGRLSDIQMAKSALLFEKVCVQFLKHRKSYPFPTRHFGFKTVNINQDIAIIRQRSTCKMFDQQDGLLYLFVAREEFKAVELKDTDGQPIWMEKAASVVTDSLEIFYSIKCMRVDTRDGHLATNRPVISDNSLHTNYFIEMAEKQIGNFISAKTETIKDGFTKCIDERRCLKGIDYDRSTASIRISLSDQTSSDEDRTSDRNCSVTFRKVSKISVEPDVAKYQYLTYFGCLLTVVPFEYKHEKICRMRTKSENPLIYCLIGSGKTNSDLEVVFFEFDTENGFTHGLSVRSKLTRFKLGILNDLPRKLSFSFLRSTAYSFYHVVNLSDSAEFELLRFHSNVCTDENWLPGVFRSIAEDGSTSQVPLSGLTVDLLCETKKGMVFVKYEAEKQEINVGVLKMMRVLKNSDLLYSVKPGDTIFPLCEIRPLTITDTTNGDIIVVCTVADMVTTFLMILPFRKRTEIMEVQCPITDMMTVNSESSILDFEMDPEGNIMFILINRDGKKCRVITKYIVPEVIQGADLW